MKILTGTVHNPRNHIGIVIMHFQANVGIEIVSAKRQANFTWIGEGFSSHRLIKFNKLLIRIQGVDTFNFATENSGK